MNLPNKPLALALISGLCLGITSPALAESSVSTKSAPVVQAQAAESSTIVDIAVGADNFKTLVAALKAADLVEALSAQGPFTVFAPTDEAFAALPDGTVETLLKPENKEKLIKILTYHVVAGDITSDKVKSGEVKSLAGEMITVKVKNGKVKVNKAEVIQADIDASNGVIHVINQVILPPDV
ncbi:MAG: fasciclin domain-containing protein [Synechocystis sp.]|nr:fasciclin domain-containing protein [Synechocystis sp.]